MTAPRIPMLPTDAAVEGGADAGLEPALAELNVFRVLLNQPDVAKWIRDLIMGLLWQSGFDARLRELVIMRLGWSTGSVYEWSQHWGIATGWLDVDPADLEAVRDWRTSERFGPPERAVLAAVDDVMEQGHISAAVFEECRTTVSDDPKVLVELVASIATWSMVSTVLQSLDVPLDDGVSPWPPDGRNPEIGRTP